ncbi:uncharacterized protein LOC100680024 isoform X2 [Nasonia vitripennis]|uniref:Uncharacterized protein n=1 Tax=Nasonia vitripennis TaxID=7425 RepID=A0A7M7H1P4_NASVI|nr:uncharacterized protein LOC100680024 isoform X2 [Nasonia vitripennis]
MVTKFDYRVPRRESVRYDYSNSLAVAIAFCSLWLLCRLKKRWLTNAQRSLCNSIAETWKRYKKVENLARAVDGTKQIVTPIKAEVDHPKNSNSSNEPAQVASTNDRLNTTSFFDINNLFAQMTERSLTIEKVYLRKHLLTSEMKLYASMRQTMEVRKMLLRVKGNEMPIGESPMKASLAQRRRSSFFDRSTKYSNVRARDGNGNSRKPESTRSLKDDVRSSELVSFVAKMINQKDEVIEKLLQHTEEILELNDNMRRENERITIEFILSSFKPTRSSPASSSSDFGISSSSTALL